MPTYNTPGVWVEEIPTLPPSVAQVATAIPAFVGYTEKGYQNGGTVARIGSLLDYESLFGKAKPSAFKATLNAGGGVDVARTDAATNNFLMYYGLSLYFRNGGGACYVVAVGGYASTPAKADFEKGLALLEKEDEPTLIVLLDAVNLLKTDYYDLAQQALAQCHKLGDRFVILDMPGGDAGALRSGTGTSYLAYGAAYHPYLQTALNYQYLENGVQVPGGAGVLQWSSVANGITVSRAGSPAGKVKVVANADNAATAVDFDTATEAGTLSIIIPAAGNATGADVVAAWKATTKDRAGFDIAANGNGSAKLTAVAAASLVVVPQTQTLDAIKATNTALYNQVKAELGDARVVLPPSPAVAGIYAKVDGERGVWKAPANVSVASVIGPVSKISNDDQSLLNVDATSGKSINAIRDFTGKGTLVWGARTLAGNDNEWRYVPVRRLFITIEESTRKASSFAVFEPNDATTWLKVKAMIDSYLYGLWEQGALAGSKPEQAYFVNVGLGRTMTAQDILEGRLIVEIGVAAVRPAEFVILRFSHKLQEA
jgi:phage tail sheath protein FI